MIKAKKTMLPCSNLFIFCAAILTMYFCTCSVTRTFSNSVCAFAALVVFFPGALFSETIIDAKNLQKTVDVYLSPRTASFVEDASFEVPILIDTKGTSINSMELTIRFDPSKIIVVNPSGGRSIIGIWIEPPSFDNSKGIVRFVGTIPGGITSNAGLIATITFKARAPGATSVRFSGDSQILLNDGYGTAVDTTFGRADYTITSKPPEGVTVFSETHPLTDRWYNNNSPTFSWDASQGTDAYSFSIDSSPLSVPDSPPVSDVHAAFEHLRDGVWYFHLKARKNGAWGNTTHYPVHIDTVPPAEFTPRVDYLAAAAAAYRGLVSFKTTDALSGIDHYEVGVLDVHNDGASPVFIQSESPYQVPLEAEVSRVIVRAFDVAGNTRDASVDIDTSSLFALMMRNIYLVGVSALLILILALIGIHYLFRHHILHYLGDAYRLFRREQSTEHSEPVIHEERIFPPPSNSPLN